MADDEKKFIIPERLLNDVVKVLKASVHPSVSWGNIENLIKQLEECELVGKK